MKDLAACPTHVRELVPGQPDLIGYCDACATGAGGFWFRSDKSMRPIVWRIPFSPEISNQVVSDTNPKGAITNSDLELAGITLHYLAFKGQEHKTPMYRYPV